MGSCKGWSGLAFRERERLEPRSCANAPARFLANLNAPSYPKPKDAEGTMFEWDCPECGAKILLEEWDDDQASCSACGRTWEIIWDEMCNDDYSDCYTLVIQGAEVIGE